MTKPSQSVFSKDAFTLPPIDPDRPFEPDQPVDPDQEFPGGPVVKRGNLANELQFLFTAAGDGVDRSAYIGTYRHRTGTVWSKYNQKGDGYWADIMLGSMADELEQALLDGASSHSWFPEGPTSARELISKAPPAVMASEIINGYHTQDNRYRFGAYKISTTDGKPTVRLVVIQAVKQRQMSIEEMVGSSGQVLTGKAVGQAMDAVSESYKKAASESGQTLQRYWHDFVAEFDEDHKYVKALHDKVNNRVYQRFSEK